MKLIEPFDILSALGSIAQVADLIIAIASTIGAVIGNDGQFIWGDEVYQYLRVE